MNTTIAHNPACRPRMIPIIDPALRHPHRLIFKRDRGIGVALILGSDAGKPP
jgi:hypothetical protein